MKSILVTCPISQAELEAYRRYPASFFGQLREPPARPETLVDWCDFYYEVYKDTPRTTLLEWMAAAPDYDRLKTLPQRDLAITYCERFGWDSFNRSNHQKKAS